VDFAQEFTRIPVGDFTGRFRSGKSLKESTRFPCGNFALWKSPQDSTRIPVGDFPGRFRPVKIACKIPPDFCRPISTCKIALHNSTCENRNRPAHGKSVRIQIPISLPRGTYQGGVCRYPMGNGFDIMAIIESDGAGRGDDTADRTARTCPPCLRSIKNTNMFTSIFPSHPITYRVHAIYRFEERFHSDFRNDSFCAG